MKYTYPSEQENYDRENRKKKSIPRFTSTRILPKACYIKKTIKQSPEQLKEGFRR